MRYTSRSKPQAIVWQNALRSKLFRVLRINDPISSESPAQLHPRTLSVDRKNEYVLQEMEIDSTPTRRIKIVFTLPTHMKGPFAAIVVIAGHNGTRYTCYESEDGDLRFANVLAQKGYATISTRISQHEVYEKGRTLMGERLGDLMRCVDFLESREEVDPQRIGCAGRSLGGEMAMWLGAMDERVQATVSSGFLTRMDHLEKKHCMCWKFPGLRELVDFSDIYSLIAPRALLCQNGLKEPRSQFTVSVARSALKDIKLIYADFGQPDDPVFIAHNQGHVIDLPSLLTFFAAHLGQQHPVDE
ncbi:MAG: prolyl oligopeptidase family serine peptidase [Kiritimatiellaeota bacterium]|nr:prolyl oligopeptidase family serine peptidase [Kiritimatiellota bacterium]